MLLSSPEYSARFEVAVMKTRAKSPMGEGVVYLTEVRRSRTDWSKEEIAYLERAAHFVRKLRVSVETDRGVTDEGDPWFVICDANSDEVLVHFCRVRRKYIACAPALESSLTGHIFADLIERFLDQISKYVPGERALQGRGASDILAPDPAEVNEHLV